MWPAGTGGAIAYKRADGGARAKFALRVDVYDIGCTSWSRSDPLPGDGDHAIHAADGVGCASRVACALRRLVRAVDAALMV